LKGQYSFFLFWTYGSNASKFHIVITICTDKMVLTVLYRQNGVNSIVQTK